MRQKFLSMALACVLSLSMAVPVFAAEQPAEIEAAGAYLREQGVYQGDNSGDLMLDKGLTRAEMAAVLTRLHGEGEVNPEYYTWACYFTDVPDWAKPYVGYCVASLLVTGYDASHYGPNDPVNPAMACTVVLRCCGYKSGEGSEWNYNTACDYAVNLGLISQSTVRAAAITRGEMAVLIHRAQKQGDTPLVKPEPVPQPGESAVSQPYTISVDHWSREDFSQQANPAVFTGVYDRALYNTIRQTLVDGGPGSTPAYTMVAKENYGAVKRLVGRMDGTHWLEHYVPDNFTNYWQYLDYFAVSIKDPEQQRAALTYIQPVITQTRQLGTDQEKVEYLHDYLCALLSYDAKAVSVVSEIFASHTGELKGSCASYARALNFLCDAAGIPSLIVSSSTHSWNLVWADGHWLYVDASADDLHGNKNALLVETYPRHTDIAPEATAFLKELLVPGSTK